MVCIQYSPYCIAHIYVVYTVLYCTVLYCTILYSMGLYTYLIPWQVNARQMRTFLVFLMSFSHCLTISSSLDGFPVLGACRRSLEESGDTAVPKCTYSHSQLLGHTPRTPYSATTRAPHPLSILWIHPWCIVHPTDVQWMASLAHTPSCLSSFCLLRQTLKQTRPLVGWKEAGEREGGLSIQPSSLANPREQTLGITAPGRMSESTHSSKHFVRILIFDTLTCIQVLRYVYIYIYKYVCVYVSMYVCV